LTTVVLPHRLLRYEVSTPLSFQLASSGLFPEVPDDDYHQHHQPCLLPFYFPGPFVVIVVVVIRVLEHIQNNDENDHFSTI
jgi:hypothetical protein